MPVAPPDLVAGDQPPDLVELGDAGLRQPGEVVATMVEVGLEVARPAPEASGDLRQDAPGEVLVPPSRASHAASTAGSRRWEWPWASRASGRT